jgi:ribosome maturation factor RimP
LGFFVQVKMKSEGLIQRLWEIIEPVVVSEGMELVELEFQREPRGWVLRLFIDREGGVTLKDCTAISRQVSDLLDVKDPIEQSYQLEVSSPGLDRPIRKPRDFERFLGHRVRVTLSESGERRRVVQGILAGVEGEALRLDQAGGTFEIPLKDVVRARLITPRE